MSMIILRGYPASGKTTWAREKAAEGNHIIISRDLVRAQITGSDEKLICDFETEQFITRVVQGQAREAIAGGWNVIIDATNLRRKHVVAWANLAHEMGVPYEVLNFMTPADECVKRDSLRANPVGAEAINNYARKFPIKNWPEITHTETATYTPYERDTTKPPAVIFDLDGTLCDMNGRDPYDASTCGDDLPREAVIAALNFVPGYVDILFVSGRSSDYFEETADWIYRRTGVVVNERNLFMRSSGDNRKDALVKSELFDKYIAENYNVLFIYDDRNQVIDMWRQKGLDAFQVAEGNF